MLVRDHCSAAGRMVDSDATWLLPMLANSSCVGYMMNSGSFNFSGNMSAISVDRNKRIYPSWYVSCNETDEYTALLTSLNIVTRAVFENQKDNFSNSNLIIAFIICGVCAGSWMLFLLLFLLPSTNLNRQNKLVPMYILYFSVFHTIILAKTTNGVFKIQYESDYQSSIKFREAIIESAWFRWNSLVCLMLCDLIWMMIVYYMFSDSQEYNSGWIPKWLNNNNKKIIFVSIVISSLHCIFSGLHIIPPSGYKSSDFNTPYLIFQYCFYTVLLASIIVYAYQLFNSTISDNNTNSASKFETCRIFFRQFSDTVPLMVYNLLTFASLYVFAILETIDYYSCDNWMMMLVGFVRILVLANTWGLIGILEKRQRRLSKETVLGRRIDGKDRLFADPKIRCEDELDHHSNESLSASNEVPHDQKAFTIGQQIFKNLRSFFLIHTRNDNNRDTLECHGMSNLNFDEHAEEQDLQDVVSTDGTVETVLTRNVLYNYDTDE